MNQEFPDPNPAEEVIQTGIAFVRAITEYHGADEGMRIWDAISEHIDPNLKGQIFFSMLTGSYSGRIIITGRLGNADKIKLIKALRSTGDPDSLGLKEAMDMLKEIDEYQRSVKIKVNPSKRIATVRDLKAAGFVLC